MTKRVHNVSGLDTNTIPHSHNHMTPIMTKRTHTPVGTVRFDWFVFFEPGLLTLSQAADYFKIP